MCGSSTPSRDLALALSSAVTAVAICIPRRMLLPASMKLILCCSATYRPTSILLLRSRVTQLNWGSLANVLAKEVNIVLTTELLVCRPLCRSLTQYATSPSVGAVGPVRPSTFYRSASQSRHLHVLGVPGIGRGLDASLIETISDLTNGFPAASWSIQYDAIGIGRTIKSDIQFY